MKVNDCSSAYNTITPVESRGAPGASDMSISATSPGFRPAKPAREAVALRPEVGEVCAPLADRLFRRDVATKRRDVGLLPHLAEALDRAGQPAAGDVRAAHAVALLDTESTDVGRPVLLVAPRACAGCAVGSTGGMPVVAG